MADNLHRLEDTKGASAKVDHTDSAIANIAADAYSRDKRFLPVPSPQPEYQLADDRNNGSRVKAPSEGWKPGPNDESKSFLPVPEPQPDHQPWHDPNELSRSKLPTPPRVWGPPQGAPTDGQVDDPTKLPPDFHIPKFDPTKLPPDFHIPKFDPKTLPPDFHIPKFDPKTLPPDGHIPKFDPKTLPPDRHTQRHHKQHHHKHGPKDVATPSITTPSIESKKPHMDGGNGGVPKMDLQKPVSIIQDGGQWPGGTAMPSLQEIELNNPYPPDSTLVIPRHPLTGPKIQWNEDLRINF